MYPLSLKGLKDESIGSKERISAFSKEISLGRPILYASHFKLFSC